MEQTPVTVAAVREVGPDAVAIELETPPGFRARPGQFVKLSAEVDGGVESRFYTISSPDVTETFEVTVGIDPEGTLAPKLADLAAGETVDVSGPFGNAYYEDEPGVVIVAGGPGVGPAVGIAERAIADGGRAAVVYQDDEPIHEDRLAALKREGAFVEILAGDDDLAAAIEGALRETGDAQVFVYGFADFLDAATDAVAAAGGSPDQAKVENFG
ncbi:oxidoreductase [Halobacteriales archaeon QS_1_68_17]|nr:MAG: oxidoreductase [Halobacteriales archaeon QS_1_68_17]